MHSVSIKQQAQKLRLQGKSYTEISALLKIAKSTLHTWLGDVQLSQQARDRIQQRYAAGAMRGLLQHNKLQTHQARQRASSNRQKGKNQIHKLSQHDLLLVGASLYWGEGYKREIIVRGRQRTHHPVSLSNADPEIIRVFLVFLRKCFNIPDQEIQISLHLYPHINEEAAIRYWQQATGLARSNFRKTIYNVSIASQRKRKFNRLQYGTAQIRVNSTVLYHQIMGLISGLIAES